MLALNVTQRTEDYGSSLNRNKATRQEQEKKKKIDTASCWLMNAFFFPSSFPTLKNPQQGLSVWKRCPDE